MNNSYEILFTNMNMVIILQTLLKLSLYLICSLIVKTLVLADCLNEYRPVSVDVCLIPLGCSPMHHWWLSVTHSRACTACIMHGQAFCHCCYTKITHLFWWWSLTGGLVMLLSKMSSFSLSFAVHALCVRQMMNDDTFRTFLSQAG